MHICAAPRLLAREIDAGVPIGLTNDAHQLALALYFSAADTSSLRNVLARHKE